MPSSKKRAGQRKKAATISKKKPRATHVEVHVKSRIVPEPLTAPDSKAYERGHGMGLDFINNFEPGERRDALLGFMASCRNALGEQMSKHDNLSTLAAGALDVVEDR